MREPMDYVEVGGKKYAIIKTGRAQAEQVLNITRWITRHGTRAIKGMALEDLSADKMSGTDFMVTFLGQLSDVLDADALIDLFVTLVGCPKEDAEVYFDIALMVDVAIDVYERQPSLRRLVERFFSQPNSTDSTEEQPTTSEQPTDGQTSK